MLIFYDGLHIEKYPDAAGVTTNCTLMSGKNYAEFYASVKDVLGWRPISFQVWEDDPCDQIREIHAIDPTIYVKVPIINTRGDWNTRALQMCVEENIPLNLTSIYTHAQLDKAAELLQSMKAPLIVSVFAGPISDIGVDPVPTIQYAKRLFQGTPAQILWAGCREVYTITRAEQAGCDIITVPDSVYERLADKGRSLDQLSIERVQKFQRDALNKPTRIH
jgi:transaldolase